MRTYPLLKSVKAELAKPNNSTVYAVRDPLMLFRYFGKENCTPVSTESPFLRALKKHCTIVPMLFAVNGAHVIDDLSAVFIRGLVACFEGNTMFVYDLETNAYVNELIEVQDRMYVVLGANRADSTVSAVQINHNKLGRDNLNRVLRKLHKLFPLLEAGPLLELDGLEAITLSEYKVLGHFLQQKHFR